MREPIDGINALMHMLMTGWKIVAWDQRGMMVKLWLRPYPPNGDYYATWYI